MLFRSLMLLFFCLFLSSVFATCPNVDVTSPFDVNEYLGVWYEISTTPITVKTFERNCYCTRANYTLEEDGSVLVQNTCNQGSVNGPVNLANGTAIIKDPSEPAKLSVSFGSPVYAPYWVIINDDYQNAVVWSCTSLGPVNVEYMWVLSRNNQMSSATYGSLTAQAQEMTGYDVSNLLLTEQQGCTYPSST